MRTTVRLNDSLLTKAKKMALERGTTLTALIDEGLRYVLSLKGKQQAKVRRYTKLKTVKGTGVCENVELDSYASLLDRMDDAS